MNNDKKTALRFGEGNDETITFNTKNAIIIGENGSGKSALMRELKNQNEEKIDIIISAHKNMSLNEKIDSGTSMKDLQETTTQFSSSPMPNNYRSITNKNNKNKNGLSGLDNKYIQIDFNPNLEFLIKSSFAEKVENHDLKQKEQKIIPKNYQTKMDIVIQKWNEIFYPIKLKAYYKEQTIKIVSANKKEYEIQELSDGEKEVLYILTKTMLAKENSIILIDEPETFLNTALLNNLIDNIENIRDDCKFIYFTHDINFASSTTSSTLLWIKNYQYPNIWEVEEIKEDKEIPQELIFKIIGTKKTKVLFVEGHENSDKMLYRKIYSDFQIYPVGGNEKVRKYTKTLRENKENFNKEYYGLIDRDLKSDKKVKELKEKKIFCTPTAIYEGLFFKKRIIETVSKELQQENKTAEILESLKKNMFNENNCNKLEEKYTKQKIYEYFFKNQQEIHNSKTDYLLPIEKIKKDVSKKINKIKSSDNIDDILKKYNLKTIKNIKGYKSNEWEKIVLELINKKDSLPKKEFKKFMPKIK